jgi:beta-phosphoglucomutase-like phosphatase (HAD superfamily)
MFSAAVFDMDGLLIDSERAIMSAWLAVAASFGVEISSGQYLQMVGRSRADCHLILTSLFGDENTFDEARAAVQAKLRDASDFVFPAKTGAFEVLDSLGVRGIPCAVASSSPLFEISHRLDGVGLSRFFQAMAGGDEVACGKPDPAVYLLAARRLGVSPERCLAFEDSANGIRAAMAAGMRVIAVPDLVRPDVSVAFMELASLGEALDHLDAWFQM